WRRHQVVRVVVNLGLAFEFGVRNVHAFMHPEFVQILAVRWIQSAAAVIGGVGVVISHSLAPEVIIGALYASRNRLWPASIHAVLKWSALISLPSVGGASNGWKGYQGRPFQDSVYRGGPQTIPGRVQCAYYDFGGEGVAYHDSDATNHGSGGLNPANGEYLNEFRMHEGVDVSYTKFKRQTQIDDNPYDLVTPP